MPLDWNTPLIYNSRHHGSNALFHADYTPWQRWQHSDFSTHTLEPDNAGNIKELSDNIKALAGNTKTRQRRQH